MPIINHLNFISTLDDSIAHVNWKIRCKRFHLLAATKQQKRKMKSNEIEWNNNKKNTTTHSSIVSLASLQSLLLSLIKKHPTHEFCFLFIKQVPGWPSRVCYQRLFCRYLNCLVASLKSSRPLLSLILVYLVASMVKFMIQHLCKVVDGVIGWFLQVNSDHSKKKLSIKAIQLATPRLQHVLEQGIFQIGWVGICLNLLP